MNKLSFCCNADMIYLGKNNVRTHIYGVLGDTFNYCCSECGKLEWSTEKEKCKYKWYKYDKEKLKRLLFKNKGDTNE